MTQSSINDWNRRVIEEFRANGGKVGGQYANLPLLLLTTTGARSGQPRIVPLAYLTDGGNIYIFAARGGAPTHPDWYHNLVANPRVTVEVGTETFDATAVVVGDEERASVFAQVPQLTQFQAKTTRKIPVVKLVRH